MKDELSDWLRGAMLKRPGRAEMSPTDVIRESKVGRSTFYGVYNGERIPDQSTLDALAAALGVPAPTLTLRTNEDQEANTPLALVRSAEILLKRAGEMLVTTSSAADDRDAPKDVGGRAIGRHNELKDQLPPTGRSRRPSQRKKNQG